MILQVESLECLETNTLELLFRSSSNVDNDDYIEY